MTFYFTKTINKNFEESVLKVIEELKKEGFGILTEIDIKETLKKKLDVDFYKYKILGACNPPFAYKALQSEDKIGLMLPCNVIVQEKNQGEISAQRCRYHRTHRSHYRLAYGENRRDRRCKLAS